MRLRWAHGSRAAYVRHRRVRYVVERFVGREDEGIGGGTPAEVPPGLGTARAEANDSVPARLLATRSAVLGNEHGRRRRQPGRLDSAETTARVAGQGPGRRQTRNYRLLHQSSPTCRSSSSCSCPSTNAPVADCVAAEAPVASAAGEERARSQPRRLIVISVCSSSPRVCPWIPRRCCSRGRWRSLRSCRRAHH